MMHYIVLLYQKTSTAIVQKNGLIGFASFCLASGLNKKDDTNQVNVLIYMMGDVADDILSSFGLSEEDKGKYDVVKIKRNAHFVKDTNVLNKQAKFNQCSQLEGETVDQFVTTLHS